MRQRMMTIYVGLLIVAVIGLALPLATTLAAQATAAMAADRTVDAARFAGLAERSVIVGSAGVMTDELTIYQDLFGIQALVLDREGQIVAASDEHLSLDTMRGVTPADGYDFPAEVASALAGTRSGADQTVWPWTTQPLLTAAPIVSGGETVGAVLTSSPVDALQRSLMLQWTLVLALVAVLLTAGVAVAGPLTRWVLKPIAELEQAATDIGGGDLRARVPIDAGPPELRHLGRSFNRMASTINRLVSRQRTFVAFAGHQVRNPLAALRLRVEALGAHIDGGAEEELALTLEEVDRLTRTCDSLITLARADAGTPPLVITDIAETLHRRVRAWLPIADRNGAVLRTGELPENATVRAFDGTIEQVLDALIDNALKFGGNEVVVDALQTTRDDAPTIEIRVCDNGPGLSDEERERAVEPFWRSPQRVAEPSRPAAGGNGLGLSVVVTLVGLQGGRLILRPASPHGVEAVLRMPAHLSTEDLSDEPSSRGSSALLPDAAAPAE